jgi:hypothetical protein
MLIGNGVRGLPKEMLGKTPVFRLVEHCSRGLAEGLEGFPLVLWQFENVPLELRPSRPQIVVPVNPSLPLDFTPQWFSIFVQQGKRRVVGLELL